MKRRSQLFLTTQRHFLLILLGTFTCKLLLRAYLNSKEGRRSRDPWILIKEVQLFQLIRRGTYPWEILWRNDRGSFGFKVKHEASCILSNLCSLADRLQGERIARNAHVVVVAALLVMLVLCAGLIRFSVETRLEKVSAPLILPADQWSGKTDG